MRHPLTGAGMSVALRDIDMLMNSLSGVESFEDIAALDNAIAKYYSANSTATLTLNVLADALYQVVTSSILKELFFAYVSSFNKVLSLGPMRLLSGICNSQFILLMHFFGVAIFGAIREMVTRPGWQSLTISVQMIREAIRIILPVLQRHKASAFIQVPIQLAGILFGVKSKQSSVNSAKKFQ